MIKGLHHNAYRCRDSGETRRFYEDFLGLPLAEVWLGPSTQPKLWALIAAVVAGGAPFTKVVAEHPLGAGDRPSVCYSTRRFAADGERAAMTLLVIETRDAEERKP